MDGTKEPQYNELFDVEAKWGRSKLGIMTNQSWNEDPKRLVFTLSRYKFVSKMLSGTRSVLEVGCADAFGSRLVKQEVDSLTVSDFDPIFIDDVKSRHSNNWPMETLVHDFLKNATDNKFAAAFALDVLEHIDLENEDVFITNIRNSLEKNGVLIIGMPSAESQKYASKASIEGHVNCKTAEELKKTMERHFHNVFIFSMNDEVVHTGFSRMSNYLLALCVNAK
jgi:cyclopropane fatty-acyl-phospholipid synthase-like methyltransferase